MVAEQAKQAKGLLAISSHCGLRALSSVALWALLLTRYQNASNQKALFPPFPCPSTCHFPFPNGIFNSDHFSVHRWTYPNNYISITKGEQY